MPQLLEAMAQAVEKKQRENDARFYRALQEVVRDAAEGADVCPERAEQAAQILDAAEVTPDKLQELVATYKQRKADRALHDQLPKLRERSHKLDNDLAEKRRQFDALTRGLAAEIREMDAELDLVTRNLIAAEFASSRLYNSFRNPEVQREEQELSRRIVAKQEAIRLQEERIRQTCDLPMAEVLQQLRGLRAEAASGRHVAEANEAIAKLEASMKGIEAQKNREERVLNGLLAEAGYLQSELERLALKHYEV